MEFLQELETRGANRLYIDGDWRESSDSNEFAVLDPATEEVLTHVSSASPEDAIAAVATAHEAGPEFAALTPRERSEILRRAFELMMERSEMIAELIVAEMGKALPEARAEAAYAAEFFRWFSGEALRNIGYINIAPGGDKRIIAVHQAIGVSLLVTPWNFPAAMATRKIGPAIVAGCTMVLKPASDTPLTALAIVRILEEATSGSWSSRRRQSDRPALEAWHRGTNRRPLRRFRLSRRIGWRHLCSGSAASVRSRRVDRCARPTRGSSKSGSAAPPTPGAGSSSPRRTRRRALLGLACPTVRFGHVPDHS